jgi:hypothetical protein
MMMRKWGVLAALLSVGLAVAGLADTPRRYSGKVLEVDLVEGRIVVESLGARGRRERHLVHVTPDTLLVSASRFRPRDMRGPNAFGELPVSLVDLLVGDFVVIEALDREGRESAGRITIVESSPAR